jgi:hypothetical protein
MLALKNIYAYAFFGSILTYHRKCRKGELFLQPYSICLSQASGQKSKSRHPFNLKHRILNKVNVYRLSINPRRSCW